MSRRRKTGTKKRSQGKRPPRPRSAPVQAALELHRAGRIELARTAYAQALQHRPNDPLLCFNYGQCLIQAGLPELALPQFKQAVKLAPERSDYQIGLANAASINAHFELTLTAGRLALQQNPRAATALYLVGYALEQLHRLDEAHAHLENALTELPNDPQLQILRAHLIGRQGSRSEAIAALQNILRTPALAAHHRQRAAHELGILLDRNAQYDAAFRAFRLSGTETAHSTTARQYDRAIRFRQIRSYRGSVANILRTQPAPTTITHDSARPALAFLVGFPRSGTTLTEQILAAHPNLTTGDELPLLTTVANHARRLLDGNVTPAGMLTRLSAEQRQTLRTQYWQEVAAAVGQIEPANTFIDKMPLNLIDLPLIHTLFPEAKILMAIRDPRDVCLSCFMQDFRLNNSMIHFLTLENTAEFYEKVLDLYLHYRSLEVFNLLEFRYEDTIADLETQARTILKHLGRQWHPDLLNFHLHARKRMISTPSAAAVREPIHPRALQRWKNYRAQLEPVIPQLRRFIKEFGYESTA